MDADVLPVEAQATLTQRNPGEAQRKVEADQSCLLSLKEPVGFNP